MSFIDMRTIEALKRQPIITEYIIYPLHNSDVSDYQVNLLNVPSLTAEDVTVVHNGKKIPHFVRSKGNVWAKIPYLYSKTPQRIYTLTGDSSASVGSNGTNTFQRVISGVGAAYFFENNPNDESSNAKNGTANNITYSAARIGQAANFNGSTGYIDLGANYFIEDVFTICFEVTNKGTNKLAYYWARIANVDEWGLIGIIYFDSNLEITASTGGAGFEHQIMCSYASLTNGDILTFVFNWPTVKLYKNGSITPVNTLTFVKHFNNNLLGALTSIGRAGAYNNYYFDGKFDSIIYFTNKALTTADIPFITTNTAWVIAGTNAYIRKYVAAAPIIKKIRQINKFLFLQEILR